MPSVFFSSRANFGLIKSFRKPISRFGILDSAQAFSIIPRSGGEQ